MSDVNIPAQAAVPSGQHPAEPAPAMAPEPAVARPEIPDWKSRLPTGVRGPILAGLLIAALFVGGFGIWGATVPISGAAVASGIVAASGLNQEVNHLEGGLISEILVAEGQRVEAGDPIIELDATRVRSERDRVTNQLVGIQARMARLLAERDGATRLEFSNELISEAASRGISDDLEQQRKEFVNRLQRHQSELDVLAQRVQATKDEMSGLEVQKKSEETKLAVIRDELVQKKDLLDRGLTPRSQYNALQRAEADSEGRIGSLIATIAQRKTSLIEIEKQINRQEAGRSEDASSQINAATLEINDLTEQLRSREDILNRITIRSPVDGVVIKLSKNTVGSVIRPGETVVEILPTSSELIIEARVSPQDIDVVRPGQNANVRFAALNTRTTPEVPASVTYISADRLVDPDTRTPYYLARLQLAGQLPAPLTLEQIYPGMPVDVFIGTGERTFFEYLARPILDSFNKAFREE